ncbi:MAG: hypothetical protein LUE86_03445, partial [Clostridiales bacterium]|nr:hypothetical protein [Clostridiales bacterium]
PSATEPATGSFLRMLWQTITPPLPDFELRLYCNPQITAMQGFFYNILSKMIRLWNKTLSRKKSLFTGAVNSRIGT